CHPTPSHDYARVAMKPKPGNAWHHRTSPRYAPSHRRDDMFPQLRSLWKALWNRSQIESELDAEMRFHVESRAQDLLRSGLSREDAHRRARIEFGSIGSCQEEV